jgi:hypothetical protein
LAEVGGAIGSIVMTVTCAASSNASFQMFEAHPNMPLWQAGIYTLPYRVTVANSNITWRRFYVCRLDSSGTSLATIASNLSVNLSFSTTGVKTATATAAGSSVVDKMDVLYMVMTLQNTAGSSQAYSFLPDQLILTPIQLMSELSDSTGLGIGRRAMGLNCV